MGKGEGDYDYAKDGREKHDHSLVKMKVTLDVFDLTKGLERGEELALEYDH